MKHRAVRWFALWCSLVVLVYWVAAARGWSPFADGPRGGTGGGTGIYARGPRHK